MTIPAILAALAASPALSLPQDGPHGVLPTALSLGQLAALGEELILDEPGDGRTWARGPRWKASFGPEGLTYIPFFGSDAPQNYPVTLDLSRVTAAGEPLWLEARQRSRAGETVSLNRGSMREVYHLTKHTVEQTFVFDSLPIRGEIVLEIEVETKLAMTPWDGGFAFSNELGEVRYGDATAIDADGRRVELIQEATAAGFRITVPKDFVNQAALPLIVDPILNTFSVTSDTRRQLDMDVAYEGNNSTYQIVLSQVQSGTDIDVIAASYNAPLDLLFPAVSIDTTSASWNMPRNASCYQEEQFLCVSIVGTGVGGRRVWGRTRHAGTGVRGQQFQISGIGAENVDVGGKGNDIVSIYDYMVVWQEVDGFNNDFDIVAQAVRGDSGLTGSRIIIDGDISDLDRYPSISKSSGTPSSSNGDNEYMITWEREISQTDHNIRAQVIEYTGSMTGHSQFNAYTFSDSLDPDVSTSATFFGYGSERYWMVAFERRIGAAYKIFTVIARDGFADPARNVHVMQNLDTGADHRDPQIAYDNQDYLLTYQTTEPNGDRNAYLTVLNVVHDDGDLRTGAALRREFLGTSEGSPGRLAIASHWDGGGPVGFGEVGDALTLWLDRDGTTGGVDVSGSIVAETDGFVIGSQYCEAALNSTGQSAWILARGGDWSTTTSISLTSTEMPQNSFGHFLVSNQSGFVVNPGGSQGNLCLQGSVGRFNRAGEIMNSGNSGRFTLRGIHADTLPSPTGLVSVQPGETWYFQCWFRDTGPSSNFSNGVAITFD